jgi:hypothetical protein
VARKGREGKAESFVASSERLARPISLKEPGVGQGPKGKGPEGIEWQRRKGREWKAWAMWPPLKGLARPVSLKEPGVGQGTKG